jgi:hypothetical protein
MAPSLAPSRSVEAMSSGRPHGASQPPPGPALTPPERGLEGWLRVAGAAAIATGDRRAAGVAIERLAP